MTSYFELVVLGYYFGLDIRNIDIKDMFLFFKISVLEGCLG